MTALLGSAATIRADILDAARLVGDNNTVLVDNVERRWPSKKSAQVIIDAAGRRWVNTHKNTYMIEGSK